jgi:hypothetical protein
MSSFWDAEDKIPVKQTKVAVQAEHGLDYTAGQKITINVPPTVQYFQPKESYLKFEVQINQGGTTGEPTRLQLDPDAGGQVLIKNIRIMSGGAGAQLLEEYQDYNVLTALKYDYEVDETIRSKRALTEGVTQYDQTTRGSRGTTQSNQASLAHTPYTAPYSGAVVPSSATAGQTTWGNVNDTPAGNGDFNAGQKKVKVLLPLQTGIFQNSKVFPCLLTEGLRLEIELESAQRVVKMLDSTRAWTKRRLAPIFHSAGADPFVPSAGGSETGLALAGRWSSDNARGARDLIKYFYVRRDNNQIGVNNFPFVVGERFTFVRNTMDPENNLNTIIAPEFTSTVGNKLVIESIEHIPGATNLTGEGGWWGLTRIGIVGTANAVAAAHGHADFWEMLGNDANNNWSMVSLSVQADASIAPSYTLSNTELVLQQLEMPAGYTRKMMSMMKEGGTLNYDFLSATNYKYSQLAGDIVANIRLPLSQSRAKAILSVPTDATAYSSRALMTGNVSNLFIDSAEGRTAVAYAPGDFTYREKKAHITGGSGTSDVASGSVVGLVNTPDGDCYSDRSGYTGIWDNASHYQWFYNGQLNPNRKVDVSKTSTQESISQQHLIELEKALAMSGIRPLSFKKFNKNAVIGRALSLQDGVYDCRGRDFNLQISYEKTDAPNKNKLWHNYVHHIRRLVIKGNMISLEI